MKLLRFGSSLIALGAFMAILLILSPALSYAQQSDADIVRSLDGAMYYYAPYGFAPRKVRGCIIIDGQQAKVYTYYGEGSSPLSRMTSDLPIVGRRFKGTGGYPLGVGEARINADTIVVDIPSGGDAGGAETRVFQRATGGQCNWTQQ